MSTAGYNDGLWHQAAFVVDTTGGRLYVDGAQKGSQPWTGLAGPVSTVQEVELGQYPGVLGMPGAVDELRLYNRALSASEVLQLFTTP
jgi:beta-galactosidase